MMIVTTTGFIVAAIGPYLADGKNSDAEILNHIIGTDTQDIKTWLQDDDIMIVDRGSWLQIFCLSIVKLRNPDADVLVFTKRPEPTHH